MADRLSKMIGTEEDKVNCAFYFKIGACRHGDTCSRIHHKPPLSQTIVFQHLYDNPPAAVAFADGLNVPQEALVEAVNHFEDFYEEVFSELAKFGEIDEVVVADNIGDHMIGNVYIKYQAEDQSQGAMNGLNGRFYAGKVIVAEYSPVTDFKEAKCRQYKEGACDRGGYCNFLHPKHVSRELKKQLFKQMYDDHPEYRDQRRERMKNQVEDRDSDHKRTSHRSRSRSGGHHHKSRGEGDRYDRRGSKHHRSGKSRSRSGHRHHSRKHESKRHHHRERSGSAGDKRREDDDKRKVRGSSRDSDYQKSGSFKPYKGQESQGVTNRTNAGGMARLTSEERRAEIAQWNEAEYGDKKQQ